MKVFTVDIAGFQADLPILTLPSGIGIAFFNLHGDNELTEHSAKALAPMLQRLSGNEISVSAITLANAASSISFTFPPSLTEEIELASAKAPRLMILSVFGRRTEESDFAP